MIEMQLPEAVAQSTRFWDLSLSVVGGALTIAVGLFIRSINRMSTRFDEKLVDLGKGFDTKIGEVKSQVEAMAKELTEIVASVCGNPRVEGDSGLAGKVQDNTKDLVALEERVISLERGPIRTRR